MIEWAEITAIGARLIPFFLLCLSVKKVNLEQRYRYRQLLMPAAALIFCIVNVLAMERLAEQVLRIVRFAESVIPFFNVFQTNAVTGLLEKSGISGLQFDDWTVLLVNTAIITMYLAYKKAVLSVLNRIWSELEEKAKLKFYFFYEQDEDGKKIILKRKWGQLKDVYHWLFVSAVVIATMIIFLAYACSEWVCFRYYRPYPVFAVIVLEAVFAYFGGLTAVEMELKPEKGKSGEKPGDVNYTGLKECYHRMFTDAIVGEYEDNWSSLKKKDVSAIIEELLRSGNNADQAFGQYLKQELQYGNPVDENYILSVQNMLRGESVIFANPFYQDLTTPVCFSMNLMLLRHGKGLVVTARYDMDEEIIDWLKNGFQKVVHVPSFWKIERMESRKLDADVAVLSAKELYNMELLNLHREFLEDVSFVLLMEPSMMLAQGQVGLSILSEMMEKNGKPVYCICDRNVEGLVDSLSHVLKVNLTEVRATVPPAKESTVMFWNADCGNLQKRVFPNIVTYLGEGIIIGALALKEGMESVTWRSDFNFPVWDMRWIAGQYYIKLCQFIGRGGNQETLYRAMRFSRNIWNLPKTEVVYNIVEDEYCNLYEIGRQFSTRGIEKSFTSVLSSAYMLRGYMCDNEQIFRQDPRAIPQITADYALTRRNTVLQMIIRMTNHPVSDWELEKLLAQTGINEPVTKETLNDLIQEYYDIKEYRQVVRLFEERMEYKEEKREVVRISYYIIQNQDFIRDYASELQNAYYLAEDDETKSHFLGGRLLSHVYQSFIPGQYYILAGKYYEIVSIVRGENQLRSAVIVRRAGEHITGRKYYRQLRSWEIAKGSWYQGSNSADSRQVNGIHIVTGYLDLIVTTDGYLEMDAYNDLNRAMRVAVTDIPKRHYRKKQVLKVVLPEANAQVRTTVAVMLQEIFRSTYSNMYDYVSVVTSFVKGTPEGMLHKLQGDVENDAIYILEDSQIDMGLLVSIERNLSRFLGLIYDYCDWVAEKRAADSGERSEDQEPRFAHTVEVEDDSIVENGDTGQCLEDMQLYYLRFGFSEFPEAINLDAVMEYLKKKGFDNNSFTKTRKKNRVVMGDGTGRTCDFCGRDLQNDSYQVLGDGRERCSVCSETVLQNPKEYEKLFHRVVSDMEIYFGIQINPNIYVKVCSTEKIQKALRRSWKPTSGYDSRAVGYAQGSKIVLENGAPRANLMVTIAHELTHIWQNDNWNDREINKKYGKDKRLDVVEGMAQWCSLRYMVLAGYRDYVERVLESELNREDEYGRGLRMYKEKYGFDYAKVIKGDTPFRHKEDPV